MKAISAHSFAENIETAINELIEKVQQGLDTIPDLAFVFVSFPLREHMENILLEIRNRIQPRHILGCTAETVLEGDREYEGVPAISIWAATLPGADIKPFHLEFGKIGQEIICAGFPQVKMPAEPPAGDKSDAVPSDSVVFMLGEPYSAAVDVAINHIQREIGNTPIYGGMASGGYRPGLNRLILDGQVLNSGVVGVLIQKGPRVRGVVSQGCRPIGKPFVVTKARDNFVLELGGLPILEQLTATLDEESPRVKELVRAGLHLGMVMNEYKEQFRRGDFLVTNVLGLDSEQQALAIGARIRVGQTVQFHVRDAETAHEDLTELLQEDQAKNPGQVAAVLLFSCNGRGTRMFQTKDHDAQVIQQMYSQVPLAGFFAAGEIGPVGDKNYIHGFTASVVLFETE